MEKRREREEARFRELCDYIGGLDRGEGSRELYERYRSILETADPAEVNRAVDWIISTFPEEERQKSLTARFIRAAGKGLLAAELPVYPPDHLLAILLEENRGWTEKFARLGALVRDFSRPKEATAPPESFFRLLEEFAPLDEHYRALQNRLFPLLETHARNYRCIRLMWSIQDDVLAGLKELRSFRTGGTGKDPERFYQVLGRFVMDARALIFREERILFPLAWKSIPPGAFDAAGERQSPGDFRWNTATGSLTGEQLEGIFRLLPVDISLIDRDDRVCFYSDPPHRLFPRTPGVIGREVRNCHPRKSLAAVEEILTAFREGSRDSARFWIRQGERFLVIQYFALRGSGGEYRGTLEVSQDATELRALEGEQRLPRWE